jgi:CDP-4-dehydro-6-deoxyglucose reductase, E3
MTRDSRSAQDSSQVRIVPGERTFRAPSGDTVLAAALAAGINLPHSCKSGHCASCKARLLLGRIDYPRGRPLGLTAEEADAGFVLLCQAHAQSDLAVEVRAVRSVVEVEIKTLPCRIEALHKLAPDVMQVMLRLPSIEHLRYEPGQYIDILLDGGRRRSFSLANPPHDSSLLELHVRLAPGKGFTQWLFDTAERGALLRIEGPIGQFIYRESARPLVLIAGGTGFAPLKAILRHVLERGSTRRIHLYWGARTPRDLYEHPTLLQWSARYDSLEYVPVLSAANTQRPTDWAGAEPLVGWVHEIVLARQTNIADCEVYAAGPPAMIEAIRSTFAARGLPPEQLNFDSFDYAPDAARS